MLERLDTSLFLFLNSLHTNFLDKLMWLLSDKLIWLPLYMAIMIIIIYSQKNRALFIIPILILAVVISDQVSVHLFKEVFQRLRPCHDPSLEDLVHIVNGKCGGKYGFVSSHAANTFGLAMLSSSILKRKWYTIMIIVWATLVSYSRIYLGVHYPGDILGGALLGILTGYGLYYIYQVLERKYFSGKDFYLKRE